MAERHIHVQDLQDRVIDVHAHVGVDIRAYANAEFPYCQSVEGLYYRHKANGVDYGVVFPLSPHLYFDIPHLARTGTMVPATDPLSSVPYERENRMLLTEVFRFCPEYRHRILPFVSVDPARDIPGQLRTLCSLEQEFPIYGIKVSPVGCQSMVTGLLKEGEALLVFAAERNLPLLLHVTVHREEQFSQVSDAIQIAGHHPELRFCLAHCVGLNREYLELAAAAPNVWVDTSALKIQVQLAYENSPVVAQPDERFDWNYGDHTEVLQELMARFPETVVWGSDSPAYAYICRRLQGSGSYQEFRLKANYEDEKAALDALAPDARRRACSTNSIAFLFGEQEAAEC